MKKFAKTLLGASLIGLLALSAASAAPGGPHQGPLLAELFTSQGCSSCPPAERLFANLADDPDYVTIEWHVDYWDDLVHGGSRWKDPFSSPAFTERQRAYNAAIRGTRAVYTPQGVLSGTHEFVGSRPTELASVRRAVAAPAARLSVAGSELAVSGQGAGTVWFVRMTAERATEVKGGENKGSRLASRNVAKGIEQLGTWTGKTKTFEIPSLKTGESCAVFVQEETQDSLPGRVLGAAYCDPPRP